jgi:hypothetical protein
MTEGTRHVELSPWSFLEDLTRVRRPLRPIRARAPLLHNSNELSSHESHSVREISNNTPRGTGSDTQIFVVADECWAIATIQQEFVLLAYQVRSGARVMGRGYMLLPKEHDHMAGGMKTWRGLDPEGWYAADLLKPGRRTKKGHPQAWRPKVLMTRRATIP